MQQPSIENCYKNDSCLSKKSKSTAFIETQQSHPYLTQTTEFHNGPWSDCMGMIAYECCEYIQSNFDEDVICKVMTSDMKRPRNYDSTRTIILIDSHDARVLASPLRG